MSTHDSEAPKTRRRPPRRTTEQLKLNLSPADAALVRLGADALGMTISGYVARLAASAGDPMRLARQRDSHAEGARLAAAVWQIPDEVRRLRAELGRAGALLKGEGSRERAEALRAFTDAGRRAEEALANVEEKLAAVRADLESAAKRLSGRA